MSKVGEAAREGFLYQLWINKPFSQSLHTINGRSVQILEKGVRNFDAGPDFLNALITMDGQMLRGDIEIHSFAGDWYSHQHHTDPRYNTVILHLVTMHTPDGFVAVRQDRTVVDTLNLDEFLEAPSEELELEQYRLDDAIKPVCLLAEQDSACKEHVLRLAGMQRLAIKAQRFTELRATAGWQQIVYSNLAVSLGYSKNHLPFARLAHILPIEKLWSYVWNDTGSMARLKCEAYLFGAAGLLPSSWVGQPASEYVQTLIELWHSFPDQRKIDPIKPGSWQFFRLRPLNFPTRRIAALAELVLRFSQEGFMAPFAKSVETFSQKPKQAIREMENRLLIGRHPFWSYHYSFNDSADRVEPTASALLAAERSREMVVNVILPALLAYCCEIESHKSLAAVRDIYSRFPRVQENEITRWMKERLFRVPQEKIKYGSQALYQQGLVHLYKSVCSGEGTCGRCLEESCWSD